MVEKSEMEVGGWVVRVGVGSDDDRAESEGGG